MYSPFLKDVQCLAWFSLYNKCRLRPQFVYLCWLLHYRVVISDKLTTFHPKIPENLTVISRHLDARPASPCSVYLVPNISAHLSIFWALSTLSSTASTILRYNYLFGILCVLSVPAPGKTSLANMITHSKKLCIYIKKKPLQYTSSGDNLLHIHYNLDRPGHLIIQ